MCPVALKEIEAKSETLVFSSVLINELISAMFPG